jgi:uncharacterized protein (DUF934 family)
MQRCGFDAFEIRDSENEEAWDKATGVISVFYQPAADGQETVVSLRHPDQGN